MKPFALWCSLFAILAAALPADKARALDPNVQVFYTASNGICGLEGAYLWQVGAELRLQGIAEVTIGSGCGDRPTPPGPAPAGHLAVRYTLWKWNGSSSVICKDFTDWWFNSNPDPRAVDRVQLTSFCGFGQYSLGVHAAWFADGAWRFGTLFTPWTFAG